MRRLIEKFTGFGLCSRADQLETRMERLAVKLTHWPF